MRPILTVPFSESKGRVVDQVIYSQNTEAAIVRWQDGAYSFIGYKASYEPGDGDLRDEELGDRDFLDQELVAAGIATQQELDQRKAEIAARVENNQRTARLLQFQRLKQEFEPGK